MNLGYLTPLMLTVLLSTGILAQAEETRPPEWAKPLKAEGVPNFFQISSNLYRSAQPTAQGMKELEKLGVKTIINLRTLHSDKDELAGTKLIGMEIPIETWDLKEEHIIKFLGILANPTNYPIAFHCQHGADRTGTMCAVYRIFVCGWTKEQAVKEMTEGGYGYHPMWKNLITTINNLDVEAIRKKIPAAGSEKQK